MPDEQFPEFVTSENDETPSQLPPHGRMTGWEQVVFQVEDEPESAFSTAAAAP